MTSMMEEQILEYIRQLRTTTTPSITTKATKIEAANQTQITCNLIELSETTYSTMKRRKSYAPD